MNDPRSNAAAAQDQAGPSSQPVDPTEKKRRDLLVTVNAVPADRAILEARHGQVWSTEELARDFEVVGFAAPLVVVKRKADGHLVIWRQLHGAMALSEANIRGDIP